MIEFIESHPAIATLALVAILNLIADASAARFPRFSAAFAGLIPHGATIVAALKKTKLPPAGPTIGVLALLSMTSCSPTGLSVAMQSARDVAVIAEPCLVAQKKRELDECGGVAACVESTEARWSSVADALDGLHAFWCGLSPQSEGCK